MARRRISRSSRNRLRSSSRSRRRSRHVGAAALFAFAAAFLAAGILIVCKPSPFIAANSIDRDGNSNGGLSVFDAASSRAFGWFFIAIAAFAAATAWQVRKKH